MSNPAGFQFLQPLWLLLLPPLWVLVWLHASRLRRLSMWTRICDSRLLRHMTLGQEQKSRAGPQPWIVVCVLTLGVIAAAAPSWSKLSYPVMESTSARVIALDLSRSMLVQDIRPNRYQHAVAAASEIVANNYQGETGLVVFAGSAFVVAPLSRDDSTLLAFIEAVHPQTMPQDGSNLAEAIDSARALLEASVSGHGQILLITAGDDEGEASVQAALEAARQGNRVSVLAIASEAGGPALDLKGGLLRNAAGEILIRKPDFELLRRIVRAGNGSLVISQAQGSGANMVEARLDANQLVESDRRVDDSTREASNDGVWLVWLMLPLALLMFRRNQLWMILAAILLVLPVDREASAADWDAFWQHRQSIAYRAYIDADYETALEMSHEPLLRGASHYRDGDYAAALHQFEMDDSIDAIYNRANALAKLQRFSEAVAAYQKVLELDPAMTDAIYNKRLIELYLQQQSTQAGENADSDIDNAPAANGEGQDALETRIGIASELQLNPADEQQLGPGFGASMQPGQVDPLESFDGQEPAMERFALRPGESEQVPDSDFMESWISSLPETSSELYRRKFLRDHQRQRRQPR